MNVLLTGANGQVGWELARQAYAHGDQAQALDSAALDITDEVAVKDIVTTSGADVVINAAAYTAVDKAEQEADSAFAVNRDGVAYLARACAASDIPLLHISTDYVFDGQQTEPYQEDDVVAPLGVYGMSKWQGEQAVRQYWSKHIILRVSWVFGSHGHNFVKTMLRLGCERQQLRVVADQQGCPTFAGAIADTLLALAQRVTDHRVTDHRVTDHRVTDHRVTDHRVTDHRVTDHRVTDHRVTDHRVTDHRVTDHRVTDHRVTDHRVTDQRVAFSSDSVWGTYHYCGTPATTWFDFAQRIFTKARDYNYEPLQLKEVIAISSADYLTAVTRPANSVLSCQRIQAQFGIIPQPWDAGLEQVLRRVVSHPEDV